MIQDAIPSNDCARARGALLCGSAFGDLYWLPHRLHVSPTGLLSGVPCRCFCTVCHCMLQYFRCTVSCLSKSYTIVCLLCCVHAASLGADMVSRDACAVLWLTPSCTMSQPAFGTELPFAFAKQKRCKAKVGKENATKHFSLYVGGEQVHHGHAASPAGQARSEPADQLCSHGGASAGAGLCRQQEPAPEVLFRARSRPEQCHPRQQRAHDAL